MTPETNHDVEISIYYDFLEDQGIDVEKLRQELPEVNDWFIYTKEHNINPLGCIGSFHSEIVGSSFGWLGNNVGGGEGISTKIGCKEDQLNDPKNQP